MMRNDMFQLKSIQILISSSIILIDSIKSWKVKSRPFCDTDGWFDVTTPG